jgi:hypothetical protein
MPNGLGVIIFAVFVGVYFLLMTLAKSKDKEK